MYVRCEVLCRLVVDDNMCLLILLVVIFMCGDRSVLLCVVCFISGLVIRCVASVNYYCESEIVHTLVCCILEVRCG